MIAEAIKRLEDLSNQASELQVITLPGEAPSVHRFVRRDGTIELIAKTPPLRRLELHTLDDLVDLASAPFDASWDQKAIFFSMNKVTLVLDYRTGYELAELAIPATAEYRFFLERAEKPSIAARELVLALQTTLVKTLYENATDRLVEQVGKLSIQGDATQTVIAGRGTEGISKSALAKVAEPAALPAALQTFDVQPFAVPDMRFRFPLTCTLHPRTADATWLLQPIEDSLLEFKADALESVRSRLDSTQVPVYAGTWSTIGNK